MTLLLNNDDMRQVLTMEMTLDALDRAYQELATGDAVCRPKMQTYLPTGDPKNAYHWVSIKATVEREVHEDDQVEGHRATETIDQAWTKYTGAEPPYGLRDPAMDERRVLFECRVDSVAVFGQP